MKTHKLMIKKHNITGMKYLCYTRSEGNYYDNYKGSGIKWKKHLKKYGDNITTELIYESYSFEDFKKMAIKKSLEYDIVNSKEWANLKMEEGDGGDTVSNKKWITDGFCDKYLNNDLPLPNGWKYGRSNCVFNSSEKQKEFSKMQSHEKRCEVVRKCWNSGKMDKRDHKKCGIKGDDNPSKRPEVREKIRIFSLSESKKRSIRMKENKVWELRHGKNNNIKSK